MWRVTGCPLKEAPWGRIVRGTEYISYTEIHKNMRLKKTHYSTIIFIYTCNETLETECTAYLYSDDIALSQQQQSFNYHQLSGSGGGNSQKRLNNNKHIYTQNILSITNMQDKLYKHKCILIGLVTMFLPKPPSVPGWWLYRCGHSRHGRGCQHLGCFSNSMCQSRPTQCRTGCLKEEQEMCCWIPLSVKWHNHASNIFNSLPLVVCSNQQWTSCAKTQNPVRRKIYFCVWFLCFKNSHKAVIQFLLLEYFWSFLIKVRSENNRQSAAS